ncbi:TetR/AcrR family transcriptional regulator [Kineococcus rhizosphaerae]|uniref:TetR/AcrR family transcriptional regulator n=1 Tax=Kineococcus rhizosphaerae TaxID=559628 RepID=UPI001475974D|nr:TetR/AcrR family transcriptional regulator [Kineococcus rhizosphaerae]
MDARAQRSFERLSAAVLDLAAERSPETLTVAEIARAAGVHRSTFYEHSDSPSALLGAVLRAELDDARERHLAGPAEHDWQAAVRSTVVEVLEHLERHRAVYLRSLGSPADGTLRTLLSEHFRASILLLSRRGALHPPVADLELVARYVAEGTVGALSAWLAGEGPREPEAFLDAYAQLVPAWWPLRAAV